MTEEEESDAEAAGIHRMPKSQHVGVMCSDTYVNGSMAAGISS